MSDPKQSLAGLVPKPPGERREQMQRVRVGLTGLAAVLLIVFLATLAITRLQAPGANNSMATVKSEDEPLAELGVAPGASDANQGAPNPLPAP